MTRRIDAGPLLVLLGAALLLVSLFLNWYEPGLTAWDVFEVVDVLIAALAVGSILVVTRLMGASTGGPDPRWLPWLAAAAFVLVAVSLLDRPPVVGAEADADVGLWLALAGAAAMAAGAVLVAARVSISLSLEPRERRRVAAVDARTDPAAAPTVTSPTVAETAKTETLLEDPVKP